MQTRVMFLGSGRFAVPIMRALFESDNYKIVGVVTQPDKPVGRKQELAPPPVKSFILSQKYECEIFQPQRLRSAEKQILEKTNPELIIVADYGQLLSKEMLDFPKFKCLNVHGSILPKLRGAVPIPVAILEGLPTTGVTIIQMTPGLDDGQILAKSEIKIENTDTSDSLYEKLSNLGAGLLIEVLPEWINGSLKVEDQNEAEATYCGKNDISKDNAKITNETDSHFAQKMIRAFYPWPVAWVEVILDGQIKRLKIFIAEESHAIAGDEGSFVRLGKRLALKLKGGGLILHDIQLEGGSRGEGKQFLFLADKKAIIK